MNQYIGEKYFLILLPFAWCDKREVEHRYENNNYLLLI